MTWMLTPAPMTISNPISTATPPSRPHSPSRRYAPRRWLRLDNPLCKHNAGGASAPRRQAPLQGVSEVEGEHKILWEISEEGYRAVEELVEDPGALRR